MANETERIDIRVNDKTKEKWVKEAFEQGVTLTEYIKARVGVVHTRKKKYKKRSVKKVVHTRIELKKVAPVIIEHTAKEGEFRSYFKK